MVFYKSFFVTGSRIQCFARAVNLDGEPGKELGSGIVTVAKTEGLCLPPRNSVGADPFIAKLRYTGTYIFYKIICKFVWQNIMPYLLFFKKQQNLKLSQVVLYIDLVLYGLIYKI